MSEQPAYEIDDLVWAKMKGFPPWPGRVTEPTEALKKSVRKNARCIFFFGSENYAWIETGCLKPYVQFKDTLIYGCKTPHFKEACRSIEEYMEKTKCEVRNNGISESESQFENLVKSEPSVPAKKKISTACNSTPNTSAKRRSKPHGESSTSDSEESKRKIKKVRNTELLTNLGLTHNHISSLPRKSDSLLNRPEVKSPEYIPLDMTKISASLLEKNIKPSSLKFGFIGLGNIGSGIVKNLLNSGHKVIVWNRNPTKCIPFEEIGAEIGETPGDVVVDANITFSCVSDPQVAKDMIFGNCGVLSGIKPGKGFVEMSGIDPDTSIDISEAVLKKGGRYLEAMIQGSKSEAEEGQLVFMSAGDKSLFDDCESSFSAIAKSSIFLGEVGAATKMSLILNSVKAISLAGLAEGMAMADRAGVPQQDMLDILEMTSVKSPMLMEKGKAMLNNSFRTNQALKHIQKDLNLSLNWANILEQPCPVTASANEIFKHAKRLGYSDHDASSVYVRTRF